MPSGQHYQAAPSGEERHDGARQPAHNPSAPRETSWSESIRNAITGQAAVLFTLPSIIIGATGIKKVLDQALDTGTFTPEQAEALKHTALKYGNGVGYSLLAVLAAIAGLNFWSAANNYSEANKEAALTGGVELPKCLNIRSGASAVAGVASFVSIILTANAAGDKTDPNGLRTVAFAAASGITLVLASILINWASREYRSEVETRMAASAPRT